ncbi:tRNAPhe (7-(3-amino-3-carboxypropyl)wyosine37-C2)-hydroxylase [Aureococcus anophagefferens]|jgi:hypothetical protein|uniref:tRNAPhe (7-(3-amino-3-carboxypropyl)wyosine37-C2)-hydroxylase n=1 Tax=Aureococcus anophagefferens TaxID=44056 RepID=A0ABR1FNQ5_AURAN
MARRRGPESSGGAGCYYVVVLGLLVSGFLIGYLNTGSYEAPAGAGAPAGSPARNLRKGASQKHDPEREVQVALEEAALNEPLDPSTWGKIPAAVPEGAAVDCSGAPPDGYPTKWAIKDIVANWNPDDMVVPDQMYQSVCRFDYATELAQAIRYRDAEVPFQLYNVPAMNEIARKWADPAYMRRKLGASTKYKCEASNPGGEVNHGANHFMYTNGRAAKNPPIKNVKLSWDDWLGKVEAAKNKSILEPDSRFYFRFSATSASDAGSGWLFKELTFFQPKPNIFFKEPKQQRGIHCRFGMTGVIAEAHWDGSRNMVGQFYGRRRYVLVDPDDSCDMYLLAKNHPSGRHSEVDWSNPDSWDKFPRFPTMKAHEVVQRPGDFLYLPTYYLHYIISIDTNYQCNTRSGKDDRQAQVVNQCTPGFTKEKRDKKKPKRKE